MKDKKGFTLIELVIAIVIIAVISAITGPIYKNYVLDAKRSEAYILLERLLNKEREYYSEYEEFFWINAGGNGRSCYIPVMGVDARSNKYFTAYLPYNGGRDKIRIGAYSDKLGSVYVEYNITGRGPIYGVKEI